MANKNDFIKMFIFFLYLFLVLFLIDWAIKCMYKGVKDNTHKEIPIPALPKHIPNINKAENELLKEDIA